MVCAAINVQRLARLLIDLIDFEWRRERQKHLDSSSAFRGGRPVNTVPRKSAIERGAAVGMCRLHRKHRLYLRDVVLIIEPVFTVSLRAGENDLLAYVNDGPHVAAGRKAPFLTHRISDDPPRPLRGNALRPDEGPPAPGPVAGNSWSSR